MSALAYYVGHSWGNNSTWFATLTEAIAFRCANLHGSAGPYGAEADDTTDGLTEDERERIEVEL